MEDSIWLQKNWNGKWTTLMQFLFDIIFKHCKSAKLLWHCNVKLAFCHSDQMSAGSLCPNSKVTVTEWPMSGTGLPEGKLNIWKYWSIEVLEEERKKFIFTQKVILYSLFIFTFLGSLPDHPTQRGCLIFAASSVCSSSRHREQLLSDSCV